MSRINKIEITKEALARIRSRTDALKVDAVFFHNSCGIGKNEICVFEERPADPEKYDLVSADGIDVYIFRGAVAGPEGLKISLASDWRAGLEVCGLDVEPTYMQD